MNKSNELPDSMNVIEISKPGGPEALVLATRPVPEPAVGQVLIKVAAAGVNFPDVMQRRGHYPPPPGVSDIPGLEIAGTVVALGYGVSEFAVGNEICALVAGGGYAAFCTAPVPQCLPIPQSFDMVMAAAIPETFFTVWTNLFDRGKLKAGETILIHGGSGGIGSAAIMTAHAMGARVFATARTKEKCAVCRDIGAERAINYMDEDFVAIVEEETNKRGVDLIIDIVGGDYTERNLSAIAMEGRLVQVAVQGGAKPQVPLFAIMQKRITLTGSTLRARAIADKGAIADALRENIWPRFESGEIKPLIHTALPLAQAAEAHTLMESSAHIGKIVLIV